MPTSRLSIEPPSRTWCCGRRSEWPSSRRGSPRWSGVSRSWSDAPRGAPRPSLARRASARRRRSGRAGRADTWGPAAIRAAGGDDRSQDRGAARALPTLRWRACAGDGRSRRADDHRGAAGPPARDPPCHAPQPCAAAAGGRSPRRHPLQVSTAGGAAGTHLGPWALALAASLNKGFGLTMRKTCAGPARPRGDQLEPRAARRKRSPAWPGGSRPPMTRSSSA